MSGASIDRVFAQREAQLRAAFLAGAGPGDMLDAMEQLKLKVREGDIDAIRVFLAYTLGSAAKAQRMLPAIKLPLGTTLAQCGEAIDVILGAMSSGLLSQAEAEAYTSVIDKRATILRAQITTDDDTGDPNRPLHVIVQSRVQAEKQTHD